ncbi:hypothetical protein NN561_007153 [Cricetulus griseus]
MGCWLVPARVLGPAGPASRGGGEVQAGRAVKDAKAEEKKTPEVLPPGENLLVDLLTEEPPPYPLPPPEAEAAPAASAETASAPPPDPSPMAHRLRGRREQPIPDSTTVPLRTGPNGQPQYWPFSASDLYNCKITILLSLQTLGWRGAADASSPALPDARSPPLPACTSPPPREASPAGPRTRAGTSQQPMSAERLSPFSPSLAHLVTLPYMRPAADSPPAGSPRRGSRPRHACLAPCPGSERAPLPPTAPLLDGERFDPRSAIWTRKKISKAKAVSPDY